MAEVRALVESMGRSVSRPVSLLYLIMREIPTSYACASGTMRTRVWLVAVLLFVAVRALPNLSYPIGRDQATFCVIGQGLLHGQQLYRDLWDNKPPGIFYIFALVVKVFGPVMWCVGVVDILWLLAISYFIFRFAKRYLGTAAAILAVVFNTSWHVGAGYWQAAQPETFLMLFIFAAFFLVTREDSWPKLRHLAAGLLFAAAFWLKYNALAFLPFLLLLPYLDASGLDGKPRRVGWMISRRPWFPRAALFATGFIATVAAVLAYFWRVGSWAALEEVQFEVLPRYAAMALERTPYYWAFVSLQTERALGSWTAPAMLVALVIAWKRRELARVAPVFLSAAMGCVSVALQVRFHPYSFETCYPFVAMLWGYLGVKIYEGFRAVAWSCAARGWRLARVLVWVWFANVVAWVVPGEIVRLTAHYEALGAWWHDRDLFHASYPWTNPISHFHDQMRVIHLLRKNAAPDDRVFVWGSEPLIYFLSERRPSTRFVTNLALISPWAPPPWREELMRDLEKSGPRFIVVARDDNVPRINYTDWDSEQYLQAFPEFAIFIFDNYQVSADLENFVIYRRRELPPGGGWASVKPSQRQR